MAGTSVRSPSIGEATAMMIDKIEKDLATAHRLLKSPEFAARMSTREGPLAEAEASQALKAISEHLVFDRLLIGPLPQRRVTVTWHHRSNGVEEQTSVDTGPGWH